MLLQIIIYNHTQNEKSRESQAAGERLVSSVASHLFSEASFSLYEWA